jgi:hypothetical protein
MVNMLPGHHPSFTTIKKLRTCREKTRIEVVTNRNAGGQTHSKYCCFFLCLNVMYVGKFDCVFDVSVITGSTKSAVSAAVRRINLLVMSARQKQQVTHFLSIPMAGEYVKKNFMFFRVITIYFYVVYSEVHVINGKVLEVTVKLCTRQYSYLFSSSALHSGDPRPKYYLIDGVSWLRVPLLSTFHLCKCQNNISLLHMF